MGFTKPPNQAYDKILFVNNCQGYPWSWPDNVPCKEVALEGKVVGLQIRQSEYKDKVSEKLHLLLQDDEFTYCVRCGLETVFSRGLLLSLRACLSQQADCPIIISPKVSERDARVIFCSLWANNQRVKIDWDKDINLYSLAQELSGKYFPSVSLGKEDHEETFGIPIVPAVEQLKEYVENQPSPKVEEVTEIKAGFGLQMYYPEPPPKVVDYQTLIVKNSADLTFLGINQEQARTILQDRYNKRSRQLLTDDELQDFVRFVGGLVEKKNAQIPDDCSF